MRVQIVIYARKTTKNMKKNISTANILIMSHRLLVTDWKYFKISACAPSTLSSACSILLSILKINLFVNIVFNSRFQVSSKFTSQPFLPAAAPYERVAGKCRPIRQLWILYLSQFLREPLHMNPENTFHFTGGSIVKEEIICNAQCRRKSALAFGSTLAQGLQLLTRKSLALASTRNPVFQKQRLVVIWS